jgi:antitoxin PrlF
MPTATITSKGQLTMPKKIRDHLKLKPGNRVDFVIERDGTVVVVPMTVHIKDLYGFLAPAPRRLSIDDMNDAIATRAVERSRR